MGSTKTSPQQFFGSPGRDALHIFRFSSFGLFRSLFKDLNSDDRDAHSALLLQWSVKQPMNQEGDSAQMQAEHHGNRTGSHQSAKNHRGKTNGKALTKKYLPAGMSFVPVPVTLTVERYSDHFLIYCWKVNIKDTVKKKDTQCYTMEKSKEQGITLGFPNSKRHYSFFWFVLIQFILACSTFIPW